MPADRWSADDLRVVDRTTELQIATERSDGTTRAWTPIWVVSAQGHVYVRSWHRRTTGWFGDAVRTGRATVRVGPIETGVVVRDVGDADPEVTAAVDAAYRATYGDVGATSMVTASARTTTLRLDRA